MDPDVGCSRLELFTYVRFSSLAFPIAWSCFGLTLLEGNPKPSPFCKIIVCEI